MPDGWVCTCGSDTAYHTFACLWTDTLGGVAALVANRASVEADPSRGAPSPRPEVIAASQATVGEWIENAYREGWSDGGNQGQPDEPSLLERDWRRSVAKAAAESHLPYFARPAASVEVGPPSVASLPRHPEGIEKALADAHRAGVLLERNWLQAVKERDKLAEFKAYVHQRLDAAGVPVDPPSEHREKGCRIGGRLDAVLPFWSEWHAAPTPPHPEGNGDLDDLVALIEDNMEDAAGCVSTAQAIIEAGYRKAAAPPPEGQDSFTLTYRKLEAQRDRAYAERDAARAEERARCLDLLGRVNPWSAGELRAALDNAATPDAIEEGPAG